MKEVDESAPLFHHESQKELTMNQSNSIKRLSLRGIKLVWRALVIVVPVVGFLLWKTLKIMLMVLGAAGEAVPKKNAFAKPLLDIHDLYPNGEPCAENYAHERWEAHSGKNRIK